MLFENHDVRALPGGLDEVLTFNSNSPEIVKTEGILLSTFPTGGKTTPDAHLDKTFSGRFDIFAHHIAWADRGDNLKTLFLGLLLNNPSPKTVTVEVQSGASYVSQPDAPFITLPSQVENGGGSIYAGPGDRVTNDVLRGRKHIEWPSQLTIEPESSAMLMSLPIPIAALNPPINGRSVLARLKSDGPVHIAALAMFAKTAPDGSERPPDLNEWEQLLESGKLAGPRDRVPTHPDGQGPLIYGRVAGIAKGSKWTATVVDKQGRPERLTLPGTGRPISYVLSTVRQGTHGTSQIQSAKMEARYKDTAYAAHGNYGIEYNITLPLYNDSNTTKEASVILQTPVKSDQCKNGLCFLSPPEDRIFFRGTVRVSYEDRNQKKTRYIHLVQRRGDRGEPLLTLPVEPGQVRAVQVDFVYPPDATPPQVLTIAVKDHSKK